MAYNVANMLNFLGISRAQLTVLGIVSKNDYTTNLARLGVTTNFKIHKSLKDAEQDIELSVARYLEHPDVVTKNAGATHFEAAIRVATVPALAEKPYVVFNRYNTVDRPPEQRPRPHKSGRNFKYRQRYAIKTRIHLQEHEAPESMKQYKLKPWKSPLESPLDPSSNKNEPRPLPKVRDVTNMVKKDLVDAMAWDHPTRTLELGTINSNVTRALNKDHSQPEPSVLLPRIKSCLSRVVRLSSKVKRTCQIAIGLYIEQLALHHIQEDERRKEDNKENGETEDDGKEDDGKKEKEGQEKDLANFSKGETEQEPTTQEGLEDVDDSGEKRNIQLQFLSCLLTAIYTAKRPSVKEKEVAGKATIVPGMPANGIEVEYPGSSFLRSAAVQLCVELKKHYKNGTIDLCKKIEVLKAKGHLPSGFVTLSELDLSRIFWRDPFLKCRIQSLAVEYFDAIQYADQVSQADVADWLTGATPGEFITKLLTDIGGYSQEERRRLRNYSRTTFLMPIEEMRAHLHHIRADSFQPATYAGRGYVLRGSIRTDGCRLQAIAFKLNELHYVKYRRLHPDRLLTGATRLQSTLGGTDYFLTEIRNVLETKQDVEDLWGCDPRLIKVLGIDLGQAFVVGASAILPPSEQPSVESDKSRTMPSWSHHHQPSRK
ncbi:hypothetical protein BGZ91_003538 [Linnemannia elongata]|nr:hypothetical protein BGZ91_003538 [Linnemannia elongata]